jgi:hypothetical protein
MHPSRKVLITGTGRSGTTFLVQLLTELGLDTGYTPKNVDANIDGHCHAGLERDLLASAEIRGVHGWLRQPKHAVRDLIYGPPPTPYVIKNPALCDTLGQVLAERRVAIDHVYIPMRDLPSAALSRVRVGGADGSVLGGLWKTAVPDEQEAVLAKMYFGLMYTLAVHDVPHTLLVFPRLAEDWAYTYHKLWFLVKDIDAGTFRAAFERVADHRLVHQFVSEGESRTPGMVAAPAPATPPVVPPPQPRPPRGRRSWLAGGGVAKPGGLRLRAGKLAGLPGLAGWMIAAAVVGGQWGDQIASRAVATRSVPPAVAVAVQASADVAPAVPSSGSDPGDSRYVRGDVLVENPAQDFRLER